LVIGIRTTRAEEKNKKKIEKRSQFIENRLVMNMIPEFKRNFRS
jgi:hypothetical protein